jgi:hypothetical protein
MWAQINAGTGVWDGVVHAAEPAALPGTAVLAIPGSYTTGASNYDPARRGFVSAPAMMLFDYVALWTPVELAWMMTCGDAVVAQAVMLTLASPTINLADARVIAGITYIAATMPLANGRAARIMAGLRPEGGL